MIRRNARANERVPRLRDIEGQLPCCAVPVHVKKRYTRSGDEASKCRADTRHSSPFFKRGEKVIGVGRAICMPLQIRTHTASKWFLPNIMLEHRQHAAEDRTASLAVLRPKDDGNGTVVQGSSGNVEDDEDEDDEESEDNATEWFGGAEMAKKSLPPAPARSRPEIVKATVAVPAPQLPARRPPPPVVKAVPSPAGSRPRSEQSSTPTAGNEQLKALFDAAGIEGLDPSTEAARTLGEILRIALGGVMEALRTRERMKDDLRMRGTSFKVADNNPLKFSANVEDAFHNLLVKQNPAYLQPTDAFEEAFRDVRDHQAAFLTAMRLAFESMLSQFDPQRMQEEFDRQMKGSILGVPVKLRYWDLYRDKYGELIENAEAGFRALFGEAFARAYEEHLERLKHSSRQPGQ